MDVAVADENRIRFDRDAWISRCQFATRPPMSCHAAAIEQTSFGQHERACTHGPEATHSRSDAAEPPDQRAITRRAACANTSGDEQRIDATPHVRERAADDELKSRRAADDAG